MMRSFYILCLTFFSVIHIFSQVGIGNNNPRGLLDVNDNPSGNTTGGLVLPVTSNPNSLIDPSTGSNTLVDGTLVYDSSQKCIAGFQNGSWSCLGSSGSSASVSIDCNSFNSNGTYVSTIPFDSNNTISYTIENNSFSTVSNVDFSSSISVTSSLGDIITVDGSSNNNVSLVSGQSIELNYTLSGTPSNESILTVDFNKLGLSCSNTIGVTKGDATFNSSFDSEVSSIYDTNPILVDIQGIIDNGSNQLTLDIPYSSGLGIYDAYTSDWIISESGSSETNSSNSFRISYPAGNLSSSGSIPVTIEVDGDGSFDPKKLSIGNSMLIASIPFNLNGVNKSTINIKIVTNPRGMKFGSYSTFDTSQYGSCTEPSNAIEDPQLSINMTDDLFNTTYSSKSRSGNFVEIDLGQNYAITGVAISGGGNSCWSNSFESYINVGGQIQYWDGSAWVDIWVPTGVTDSAILIHDFGSIITTSKIRYTDDSWLAAGNIYPVGYY